MMKNYKPTPRRFSGVELTEIEQNIDYYRRTAAADFYERLEATLDDAMKSELYERVERVQRIFTVVGQNYIAALKQLQLQKEQSESFAKEIMQ